MKKEKRVSDPLKKKDFVNHKRDNEGPSHHKGFQFGDSPMRETSFEKACIMKEKIERHVAKVSYVMGIQGVDGGCCCEISTDY